MCSLCCSMYFCVLCIVCFVAFPVLFVCICALNNCHRVATQLQLNISYHILLVLSMRFISRCTDPQTSSCCLFWESYVDPIQLWVKFCGLSKLKHVVLIKPLRIWGRYSYLCWEELSNTVSQLVFGIFVNSLQNVSRNIGGNHRQIRTYKHRVSLQL